MAESALLGTATVPDLIRESDPDVLLALTAVNKQVMELRQAMDKNLARLIAVELAKIWK